MLYFFLVFSIPLVSSSHWRSVCRGDEGGGIEVLADIVGIFNQSNREQVVLVSNDNSDVQVRCNNTIGDAKMHDEEDNQISSSQIESLEGGISSVKSVLWKRNETLFWRSESLVKCNEIHSEGSKDSCRVRVALVKDGSKFRSNCSTEGQRVWCDVREWVQVAQSEKGWPMKCEEVDDYDHKASYTFSTLDSGSGKWVDCGEHNITRSKVVQDSEMTVFNCPSTGMLSLAHGLLVRMHKEHKSKVQAGLSFLNSKPNCQESAFFLISQEVPVLETILGQKAHVVFIILVLSAFLMLFMFCLLKNYKKRMGSKTPRKKDPTYIEEGLIDSSSSTSESSEMSRVSNIEDVTQYLPSAPQATLQPQQIDRQCSIKADGASRFDALEELVKQTPASSVLDGDSQKLNPSLPLQQQLRHLHYDRRFERPKNSFSISYIIGEGQFGSVYLGSANNIFGAEKTKVAVKQAKPTTDMSVIDVVIDELKILSSLDMHFNLVNLLGACTEEYAPPARNELYLLLEYCPHGDLKRLLVDKRSLFTASLQGLPGHHESEFCGDLLWSWSHDVACGMTYLAGRGIMHGDLAARNILVGESYVAKISDFGLSKAMYYNQGYKKTARKLIPWAWMATEYLQTGEFNMRSDVWSFGVVLWEVFTLGNKPYGFDAYELTKTKILNEGYRLERPENLEWLEGGTELYSLMLECWDAEAGRRPSFSTILERLQALVGEEGLARYSKRRDEYDRRVTERLTSDLKTSSLNTPDHPGEGYVRVNSKDEEPVVSPPHHSSYVTMEALKEGNIATNVCSLSPRARGVSKSDMKPQDGLTNDSFDQQQGYIQAKPSDRGYVGLQDLK